MGDAAYRSSRASVLRLALLSAFAACGDLAATTEPVPLPSGAAPATAVALLTPFDSVAPMERKASDSLPSSLAVQLRDATGQAVKQAGRILTLSVLDANGAPSTRMRIVRGDATPTDTAGVARVTDLVLAGRAGDAVLAAKIDSLPAVTVPVRLRAGATSRTASAVTIAPDSVPVGGVAQVTVTPLDADGNKRGAAEQVSATLDGDQALATVGAFTYTPTDSSYRATITVIAPAAPRALRVNVTGVSLTTTLLFTGIAAPPPPASPASALRLVTLPGDTTGGYRTLSGAVWASTTVQLIDASGTAVRQAGVAVTGRVTNVAGQALPSSTLTGANAVSTNAAGQAVFPGIALTAPAGAARMRFESGTLAAAGFPVQVAAGVVSASQSTLSIARDTIYVDSTTTIRVVPRDAAGSALGSGASVALAVSGGTSVGTVGAFSYVAADSSYRASFTGTTRGTATTIRATVNATQINASAGVTVIIQASSPVTVTPDSIAVGAVAQLVTTPLNAAGLKLGAGQTVTVALSGGTSAATVGTVTYSAGDSSYRASITGVTAGTTTTVTTTINGVVLTATRPLKVIAGSPPPPTPATAILITTLPGDTTAGGLDVQSGALLNGVTVSLRNASGGAVAQAGVPITVTAVTAGGAAWVGATLTGGGPLSTGADGTITFPALRLSATIGTGRLQFSATGLTSTSLPVRVRAGAVSSVTSTMTLTPDTVVVNATSLAAVTLRDAQSNKIGSGQTVTFSLGTGTSGITIGATSFNAGDSTYRATLTGTTAGTARVVTAAFSGTAITQTRTMTVIALTGADISATVNGGSTFAISRYIYGLNFVDGAWGVTAPAEVTFNRIGGNRLTAYNWENNYSNAGSDYLFNNDNNLSSSTTPGEAVRGPAQLTFGRGQALMATIPMLGYVSADGNGPVTTSDADRANRLATRFRVSRAAKGSAFTLTPNASDGFVYQDEFVNWFNSTFPGRAAHSTAPVFFSLDNEPDLWHFTHKEIQSDLNDNSSTPRLQTYRGYTDTSVVYSKAIKSAMPGALVFGPATAVWSGPVNLGRYPTPDPDYGTQNFFDVYLTRMAAASAADGRRLLDVLDLHFYPEIEVNGERLWNDFAQQSAAMIQARLQAPRSLWDPTFDENTWVSASVGGPIRLIPRLRDQIAARYPGTKIAITEYSYGRGGDISGGIAQADALGIFGREGVFAATLWPLGNSSASGMPFGAYAYAFGAFKSYRNYDGAGNGFNDVGLAATNSDAVNSSIYASQGTGGKPVLVVINKASTSRVIRITLSGVGSPTTAQVWRMVSGTPNPTRQTDVAISAGVITYTMPALSVSTLALTP